MIHHTIAIGIETSTIAKIQVGEPRHRTCAIGAEIIIAIREAKIATRDLLIVDVETVVLVATLEDVQQAIAVGIAPVGDSRRSTIATFGDIVDTVLIAVDVNDIGCIILVGIHRDQTTTSRYRSIRTVLVVSIVQAITIGVDSTRGDIVAGS